MFSLKETADEPQRYLFKLKTAVSQLARYAYTHLLYCWFKRRTSVVPVKGFSLWKSCDFLFLSHVCVYVCVFIYYKTSDDFISAAQAYSVHCPLVKINNYIVISPPLLVFSGVCLLLHHCIQIKQHLERLHGPPLAFLTSPPCNYYYEHSTAKYIP